MTKSLQRKSQALERSIIDFQRQMLRPIPVRFEVRKIGDQASEEWYRLRILACIPEW